MPLVGNNFYKNHSLIDSKIIRRPFKGPLYNEAGKICIDLTQRYEPLENFVFQTQLDNMNYQICHIQEQKIQLKRQFEQRQLQRQKAAAAQIQKQRVAKKGEIQMQQKQSEM